MGWSTRLLKTNEKVVGPLVVTCLLAANRTLARMRIGDVAECELQSFSGELYLPDAMELVIVSGEALCCTRQP